jgi:NAD(P)-dependent dehydrogenase (short-subunit alcohol dehydrogenase family)
VGLDKKIVVGMPEECLLIETDCADLKAIASAIEKIIGTWGRIDVVVNNAAVQVNKPALETTMNDWDNLFHVNLRAAFFLAKECHLYLKHQGGCIVNVASVHAVATSVNVAAYAASKGGLVALTRALAVEWAQDKIRVNAVLPGAVDTPMLREGLTRGHLSGSDVQDLLQQLGARTVMGRVGQPQEIAEAVLFLADPKRSSFITGHSLVVDGGATMRLSTE